MLKTKLIKIIIAGLIVAIGVWQTDIVANILDRQTTARAVGDLTIDWGVPSGQAIFVVENMMPGDEETREITITNDASTLRPVGVRGIKTEETGGLASVLKIIILVDGTEIYGSGGTKTVQQFFDESNGTNSIPLFDISPNSTKTITFKVMFPENAGNVYQGKRLVFDLVIGIAIAIPEECRDINFSGQPIFGTQGNDRLKGTNGNDLIYGLEGNDRIDGSNGNDCLVGGDGNDILDGSNGNDFILGNDGNDRVYGDDGNDKLYGKNGNDFLEGGNGIDHADGGLNRDQCDAETETKCEF